MPILPITWDCCVKVRSRCAAADPDARIVLAALAPNVEPGGANLSDITYLDQLYGLGAQAWFDVVAAQPYGFDLPPDASADPGRLDFQRVLLLRSVMDRHADLDTPVWATAFGWQAAPYGSLSEDEQAHYTGAALALAGTHWSWLGPLFWPAYCPQLPAGDARQGFAVCGTGDTPAAGVAGTYRGRAVPGSPIARRACGRSSCPALQLRLARDPTGRRSRW